MQKAIEEQDHFQDCDIPFTARVDVNTVDNIIQEIEFITCEEKG